MVKHHKRQITIVVISSILLLILIAVSYFLITSSNANNEKVNALSSTVSIHYTDCGSNKQSDCGNINKNLTPGESVTKTFRVENNGTVSTGFEIIFKELSNTFVNNELVYKVLDENDNEVVNETPVPYGTNEGLTIFVSPIQSGITKNYKFILTFKETTGDQNANLSATYSIKLGIKSSSTVVAQNTFSKLQSLNHDYAVKTATPNFANISPMPSKYRDDGINNLESYINLSINTYYITYGDSYIFNSSNGTYTLVNPRSCQWSECYSQITDKYFCSYYIYSDSGLHNYSNQSIIYQVTSNSTSSTLKYKTGVKTILEYDDLDTGIFKMEDNYGTSLYFRGNVQNNYVKFGKNTSNQDLYWRILRINGDGSLRILYDGTSPHPNGQSSSDRLIGNSAFNSEAGSPYDNGYAGYMYGDFTPPQNCTCSSYSSNGSCIYSCASGGSTSYSEAHSNINSSTVKTYLENWYEQNIKNTSFNDYVSDEIFCNDRSKTNEFLGYGQSQGNFGAYIRNVQSRSPSFICPQKNDSFTVSDTINGNGKLSYPIGLITMDELATSGSTWNSQPSISSYTFKGNMYWTMSPAAVAEYGYIGIIDISSYVNTYYAVGQGGVVPVINLTTDAVSNFTGDGTMNNPFTISS